jgi:hypothetical protein
MKSDPGPPMTLGGAAAAQVSRHLGGIRFDLMSALSTPDD